MLGVDGLPCYLAGNILTSSLPSFFASAANDCFLISLTVLSPRPGNTLEKCLTAAALPFSAAYLAILAR